ncbi:MAG TPA: hydantoinase/oxoprolinase family protein [Candidatus Acidoferrales bacterium]|nr:hydantoinase/oxoprolinase family protein [Candidatus Acidoferrales bacterium]
MSSLRVAIDAGGTFTDCVFVRDGELQILKVLSTPGNPSRAIAEAVERVVDQQGDGNWQPLDLTCGTTVGTNALLERRGGRIALVTTAGFEDVIEIGRQARPRLYDFFVRRPETLVPRDRRFGLRERVSVEGRALMRPSRAEIERILRLVRKSRADAVAVCLLFSFANPAHERELARKLRAEGRAVSASQEIFPEFREYERTATTVVNAYLLPVMSRYLSEIARLANSAPHASTKHSRTGSRVRVMQSSGGIISAAIAAREPVRTILSGPAGGVLGAQHVAELAGFAKIISFDMGGTSTDVALIDGPLRTTNESEVAGLPVAVPMLDIHTVGAGGGSLARFDRGGALRVGPESSGADPGPICYGRGTRPTVTDAHLILGRITPQGLLGGEFRLDLQRTREWLGRARGAMRSVEEFAQGILDVVETNMEKAIRVISVERGYDPRDYTLVAFGGAGGLHACGLASALEIPRVLVPKFPGGLSALGILRADAVKDFSKTVILSVDSERQARRELQRHFSAIERQAVRDMRNEGFAPPQIRIEKLLDMRYIGQAFELTVPAAGNFVRSFHAAHEKRYGYSDAKRAVEIVNIRARAIGLTPKPELSRLRKGHADARVATVGNSRVIFAGKKLATNIYDRARLLAGNRLRGPAIVAEYSATTVIEPGWQGRVDAYGDLILERAR